jgi:hypothetical protein
MQLSRKKLFFFIIFNAAPRRVRQGGFLAKAPCIPMRQCSLGFPTDITIGCKLVACGEQGSLV